MAKIIKFTPRQNIDPALIKLCDLADDIDAVVKHYIVQDEIEVRDVIGVLAHRLGSLLNVIESKDELWAVCEDVLRRQASLKKKTK